MQLSNSLSFLLMDFQISSTLIALFLTLFFVFKLQRLIKNYIYGKFGNINPKFPPGPLKLPFIGNMFSMISQQPPHHVLKKLAQKHGPLMHLQLGEVSALIVSSPKVAKEIIIKHDLKFANRPDILVSKIILYNNTDIAFSPYGSYWRQIRKICTLELLSAKKVNSFSYIREEEVKLLIDSIFSSSGSVINLSEKIFTLTNTVTSRAAFGKIYKDQDLLVQMLQEMADLAGGFDVADLFPSYKFLHVVTRMSSKLEKIHQNLENIFSNVIGEHEKDKKNAKGGKDKEDLLDILFRLKESGDLEFPITTDNIKAVILDVFSAGTDTTSSTVEWAMSELIKNPEILKKAQTEVRQVFKGKEVIQESDIQQLKYLKLVIKETMRLHPALPLLLPRECLESCEIDGFMIPVKTKVIVNAWALGRDPEYWRDADSFVPERFEKSDIDFSGSNLNYLPFGAGRRMCPGSLFALANVEIILSHLLYHFNWEIPGGIKPADLDMSESFGAACRRKVNLSLIPTPYTPL